MKSSEKNVVNGLILRPYQNTFCETVSRLFYETVHLINARDYTEEQLFAWASDDQQLRMRGNDLLRQNTLVAESGNQIVGFGSMDQTGCLDLLFVHKDFQRQGIATALCNELEQGFSAIKTYASVTAKPFFEERGYVVTKTQEVVRFGVKLRNYEMHKTIKNSMKV